MSDIFRDYSFGGWIKELRVQSGFTLREFAERINMNAGNLSKLERSELNPPKTAKRIEEICFALGKMESATLLKSLAYQHHLAVFRSKFFLSNREAGHE